MQVERLYQKLTEITHQTPEAFHFNDLELRDGELYYKGKSMSLMTGGEKLRSVLIIAKILGMEGLHKLGFGIPIGKLIAQQAVMLNRVEEELPSMSDMAKADDIELQEITENAVRSMKDLIIQLEDQMHSLIEHPLHKLLGLDKEPRSIMGSLKVEMVKKVQLQKCIEREKCKLFEIWDNPEYHYGI